MLIRIVVVAALVVAVMVTVKDGRVLRAIGVAGSCRAVPTATGGRLEACRPGLLARAPSLVGRGCTAAGVSGAFEYWRCPPGPQASAAGR